MQNIHSMKQLAQAISRLVTTSGVSYTTGPVRPNKEVTLLVEDIHSFYLYPNTSAMKTFVDDLAKSAKTSLLYVVDKEIILTPADGRYRKNIAVLDDSESDQSNSLDEIDELKSKIINDDPLTPPEDESDPSDESDSESDFEGDENKESSNEITGGLNVHLLSVDELPNTVVAESQGEGDITARGLTAHMKTVDELGFSDSPENSNEDGDATGGSTDSPDEGDNQSAPSDSVSNPFGDLEPEAPATDRSNRSNRNKNKRR